MRSAPLLYDSQLLISKLRTQQPGLKGQEGDHRNEVERSESPLLDSQLCTSRHTIQQPSLKGQEGVKHSRAERGEARHAPAL